ncbi:DUF3010 domain-containing protein [Shewanella sp. OPT22]|uniref:DUF3010 family protein n=1 Tax=Parashewanella hymeniacidonis TaxID=2807618 RepID=UPI0010206FE9|nr:DUF3010 family protein [Parashewanella hymeniacidonis]MBM7071643.1 DUF3010 family protein [Parashewanella hymeniacidonis]RYV02834.1 DUF3010 domain-containing protein [Shewanella sp. OPT22]
MKVCGIELTGGDAILTMVSFEGDTFTVPECRKRSFSVSKSAEQESIVDFQFAFQKLMEDYHVDKVVIIERHQKGKHMGTATGFKLEAAIQLSGLPVELISTLSIKEQLKRNPPHVDFDALELKRFQKPAFEAAYAYQTLTIYSK